MPFTVLQCVNRYIIYIDGHESKPAISSLAIVE